MTVAAAADAWAIADPIPCDVCGLEACEEHVPAVALVTIGDETAVQREYLRERARREARRRLDAEDRRRSDIPEVLTLRERLTRPAPVTRWRIHGWQPIESRILLAAQFKSGKTTLVSGLLRSLVDGSAWLGCADVSPVTGTVALLDTEMAPSQLDAWTRVQAIRNDDRIVVIPLRGRVASFNPLDTTNRMQWAERLRLHRVAYLVLDCFRPVLDSLGLDEHRDAGQLLVALDELLHQAGIPECLVVHHMGHTNERARGDSRLRDWPDVEWRIVRQDEDPASLRFISAYGRDVEIPEAQLDYEPATRRLSIAGGSRRDAAARSALDDVVAILDQRPQPLSGRAIKAALADSDHTRAEIEAAIRLGVESGSLLAEDGPRRARLYRHQGASVPSVPAASQDTPSECPVRYIGRDTRTLLSVQSSLLDTRDTHSVEDRDVSQI